MLIRRSFEERFLSGLRASNCLHFVGLCALRDKGPRHKDVHAQWQINFSFKFQKFFTKSCAFLEFGLVASAKPLLCRGEHRKFGIEGETGESSAHSWGCLITSSSLF